MKYCALIFCTLAVAAGATVNASVFFIPNYYRHDIDPDLYASLGWSTRKTFGLEYSNTKSAQSYDSGAWSSDLQTTSQSYYPFAFYRFDDGLNLQITAPQTRISRHGGPVLSESTTGQRTYAIGAGYEFADVPIAVSFRYLHSNASKVEYNTLVIDSSCSSLPCPPFNPDFSSSSNEMQIGFGYRLPGNNYLGLALDQYVENTRFDANVLTQRIGVGYGSVVGEKESPTAALETGFFIANGSGTQTYSLVIQGLRNIQDWQVTGVAQILRNDGPNPDYEYTAKLGCDYQFSVFYVGPEVSYFVANSPLASVADVSETAFGLEAGLRLKPVVVFLSYGVSDRTDSFGNMGLSQAFFADTKTKGAPFSAGLYAGF